MKRWGRNPLLSWNVHWFLLAIFVVILLAEIYPNFGARGGPLLPELTVEYGVVSSVFFLSGFAIKYEDMTKAAKLYDLHIIIQTFSLLLVPALVKLLTIILIKLNFDEWILKGLIVVSCMPPSYSSIIMTRAVGGNEAVAVFSSVLGSLLGIFTTPFTLLMFLHTTALLPPMSTLVELFFTITLPLAVGKTIQSFTAFTVSKNVLEKTGQTALLLVMYTTFCDMFAFHRDSTLQPVSMVLTIFLVVVIQIVLLLCIYWAATRLVVNKLSPTEVTAILFVSTHKSLSLGIPIVRMMYAGYNHLFAISLPLLVYYPIQIILSGLLAGELCNWMAQEQAKSTDFT